jgi:WD40 repeat protein
MSSQNSDLLCSISTNGDTVALCTPDGVIKFYDTLTSNLKLEYSSSTHLQASCTCLSWPEYKRTELNAALPLPVKQKKAKTSAGNNSDSATTNTIETELNDLNLISIGTSEGAILLYSLTKADLHTQLVF